MKDSMKNKRIENMNEFTQTNMDKGITDSATEAPVSDYRFNSLPLQTVWTQNRPDKMSGLIWIKTVWHSDGMPERIFLKNDFEKKSADNTKS